MFIIIAEETTHSHLRTPPSIARILFLAKNKKPLPNQTMRRGWKKLVPLSSFPADPSASVALVVRGRSWHPACRI